MRLVEVHERNVQLLHDLAGCYGDQLEGDLSAGQDVLGVVGALLDVGEDERGASRRDDAVGGARGLGRRHRRAASVHALLVLVSLNVLGQVVAPHEALGTFRTDELLLSCTGDGKRSPTSKYTALQPRHRRYNLVTNATTSSPTLQPRHRRYNLDNKMEWPYIV